MAPTGTATRRGQHEREQPRDVIAVGEVPERRGADRREREVAERDLTGDAHQQAEREEQDRVRQEGRPDRQMVAHHVRDEAQHDEDHSERGKPDPPGRVPSLANGKRRHDPALRKSCLGRDDQSNEQDDERDGRGQPAQPADRDGVLGRERARDTDEEATGEGQRKTGEVADRCCPERVDDERRDDHGVQAQAGGEQQSRHGAERHADDPGPASHPYGVLAGHRQEIGVVDDPAHGEPHPDVAEEVIQDRRRNDGDDRDNDLIPTDVHAENRNSRTG